MLPHQLVVAVVGGAEGLIHTARQWIAIHRQEEDMILLQKDVKNVFNTVLPEEFLYDCRRFAPASAHLAEYCYASESNLVYDGTIYRNSRGQQGCPMMMALFCLTRKRHAEEIAVLCGVVPPFRPEYADDGFSGGRVQEVLKYFQAEIQLARKFGLSYDFSQCKLYISWRGRDSGEMSRPSRLWGCR